MQGSGGGKTVHCFPSMRHPCSSLRISFSTNKGVTALMVLVGGVSPSMHEVREENSYNCDHWESLTGTLYQFTHQATEEVTSLPVGAGSSGYLFTGSHVPSMIHLVSCIGFMNASLLELLGGS
ncbi:hypothetical protein CHUAL_009492 [Chamberlinius hualienensis]